MLSSMSRDVTVTPAQSQSQVPGDSPGATEPVPPAPLPERTTETPSATAQRVIEAARTILRRDGFDGLTLRAINKEAGISNRGVTSYYFGGKAGLLEAVMRDIITEFVQATFGDLPLDAPLEERVDAFVEAFRLYHERTVYLGFFSMIPYVVRDEELRAHYEAEYERYYALLLEYFFRDGLEDESLRGSLESVARFVAALDDGIGLQMLIHRDNYDLESMLESLRRYLLMALQVHNRAATESQKSFATHTGLTTG